ncbi:hypothetical protein G8V07_12515 [Clostridium botulinum D/C]|uniref:hypothetical protein n=1 Tax=Clostridium botulinum TaxID=1491 RepID=UPI001E5830D8|nr:hypothetical protein [Clostridium botulinum]MCD3321132.1 hypothetical protein [Clostridium botulinum D/C]MCD3324572.1 hypothetical protein [Clostridium botulinum D/C]MCD3326862.1 hypothetical protein [Clostridium botulinum D/C]
MYELNTKQKPAPKTVPYDKIDKELIEVIKLLNDKGFKTKHCCWGHRSRESVFILFDQSINKRDMAKLSYKLRDFYYKSYEWMRYCEPKEDVWSNWVLEYPAHNIPKNEQMYEELKMELNNKLIRTLKEMEYRV